MFTLIVLLTLFYASHSFLAAESVKKTIANSFPNTYRFYRLLYTFFSLLFFSYIVWFFIEKHEYEFLFSTESALLKYGAVTLSLLGLAMVAFAVIRYSFTEFTGLNALLPIPKTRKTSSLNVSGMNGLVRHPIYTGILIALIGLFLLLPTKMTLAAVITSLVYLEIGIRLEEQKLIKEFGDAYKDYQHRVKKVIPFLY